MSQDLLKTFAYFTAQKRLVTIEEVHRYQLHTRYTLQELETQLQHIPQIHYQNGLYGLKEYYDTLLPLRQEKGRESLRRYRRLQKYGQLLTNLPYIRGVFIAGSTGFSTGNAKKSSDIDLFIVTKANTIWISRIIITIITHILGIRRVGDNEENRICLNHYITDNNLIRSDQTIYSAQLYADYIALGHHSQQVLNQFWQANQWIYDIFPQAKPRIYHIFSHIQYSPWQYRCEWILDHLSPDIWNTLAKWLQTRKIQSNSIQPTPHNRIQVSDRELEFHPEPNSPKIEQTMNHILQTL